MKRVMLFLLLLVGLLCQSCNWELPVVEAAQVGLLWDYDYGADPVCATATSVDCVSGFEVLRAGSILLVVPNPANASGVVTDIAATVLIGPPYGQVTIGVVAVGRDISGARVLSLPATATVFIRPGPPTNVRGQ